jgi:ribosome-associated translation inhibitor RaiA
MKIILRQLHHQPSPAVSDLIRNHFANLGRQILIEQARVTIDRRSEMSPAFSISAHIVTPGPDLVAYARDHTVLAALQKAITQLKQAIRHRRAKRAQRVRSNLQEPAARRNRTWAMMRRA